MAQRRRRAEAREFIAEGPQAVAEAISSGHVLELVLTRSAAQRHRELLEWARDAMVGCGVVDDAALAGVSETVNPQGVVARCSFVDVPLEEALDDVVALVAIGVDVRDPGNAGSLIRCADAAGADAVVFTAHSIDPYNAKAVRASVGSIFHLPLVIEPDVTLVLDAVRAHGAQVFAADGAARLDLATAADQNMLGSPTAWLFGNEAHGLDARVIASADHAIAVPIYGRAESLNLATAAAVCLYASAEGRRRNAANCDGEG